MPLQVVRCPRCGAEVYETVTVTLAVAVQRNATRLIRGRLLQTPPAIAQRVRDQGSEVPAASTLSCRTSWCQWTGIAAQLLARDTDTELSPRAPPTTAKPFPLTGRRRHGNHASVLPPGGRGGWAP